MRHRTRSRNAGRLPSGAGVRYALFAAFGGPDGTDLNNYPLDVGGRWVVQSGTWQLSGGKALLTTSSGGQETAVADAGRANGTVTCFITTPAAGVIDCGLVGRATDDNNYWLLAVNATGLTLYERNGGAFTSRATAAVVVANATTFRFDLAFAGQTVTGFLNGAQQLQYASASFNATATKFGLRCNGTAGEITPPRSMFDNFSFA